MRTIVDVQRSLPRPKRYEDREDHRGRVVEDVRDLNNRCVRSEIESANKYLRVETTVAQFPKRTGFVASRTHVGALPI